ncbi:hypothetical protein BU14_1531s0001 [Porphyra umbilicalis]|uniref:t-SNARE coiled-coil homology domain-containing protein n=1 Tax=Porphyra umbilicalis TaxID=2786 RepID=A0A1X6NL97_PORUM|nr:hypothetical protein BU14_1531s0001 [Porphyra umbilicalis]|eukprot:OSX69419.1 hypothetical protein BU14_1531s0001 [Porphyra umbilicalis]
MTDRLAELKAGLSSDGSSSEDPEDYGQVERDPDLEDPAAASGATLDDAGKAALAKFFAETEAIGTALDKMEESISTLDTRYGDALDDGAGGGGGGGGAAAAAAGREEEIAALLEATDKRSHAVRTRLKRIGDENRAFASAYAHAVGEIRVRVTQHQALTKRYMAVMQRLEATQDKHRDDVATALARRLRAANPSASDAAIETAVRTGNVAAVMDGSPTLAAMEPAQQHRLRAGLEDLASRNADLQKVEASIVALHQMFVDMQLLVQTQGELLDNIEYNVAETVQQTEAAHVELVQAREHQKSAGKKKCCIILLVLAILAAILVPLAIVFIPKAIKAGKDLADDVSSGDVFKPGGGDSTADAPAEAAAAPAAAPALARRASAGRLLGRGRGVAPRRAAVVAAAAARAPGGRRGR